MTVANPDGPINLLRDFTPLAINYAYTGEILVVRSDSEFKSLENVLDYARKKPAKLIISPGMVGTGLYLDVLLLNREAKINSIHLPFSTMTESV